MLPANLINLSDASTTLEQAGTYSAPMFTSLYPMALVAVGLIIGGMLVAWFIDSIISGIRAAWGSKHASKYEH